MCGGWTCEHKESVPGVQSVVLCALRISALRKEGSTASPENQCPVCTVRTKNQESMTGV